MTAVICLSFLSAKLVIQVTKQIGSSLKAILSNLSLFLGSSTVKLGELYNMLT